jgi:hypothetical protein
MEALEMSGEKNGCRYHMGELMMFLGHLAVRFLFRVRWGAFERLSVVGGSSGPKALEGKELGHCFAVDILLGLCFAVDILFGLCFAVDILFGLCFAVDILFGLCFCCSEEEFGLPFRVGGCIRFARSHLEAVLLDLDHF